MPLNKGFSGEQRADQRYINGYPLEAVVDTLFKRSDAVTHMFMSGIQAANRLNRGDADEKTMQADLEAVARADAWIAKRDEALVAQEVALIPDTVPDKMPPNNAPVSPAVGGAVGNAAIRELVHAQSVNA